MSLDWSQYIYNILSILAFLMSSFLFICRLIASRKDISIKVIDYATRSSVAQLFILFQNNSSTSITIHSLSIFVDGKEYFCDLVPKPVYKNEFRFLQTPMFPLNLSPKEGVLHFLEFLLFQDNQLSPGKKVVVKICTNRGPLSKSVVLGNTSHYLHMRH